MKKAEENICADVKASAFSGTLYSYAGAGLCGQWPAGLHTVRGTPRGSRRYGPQCTATAPVAFEERGERAVALEESCSGHSGTTVSSSLTPPGPEALACNPGGACFPS